MSERCFVAEPVRVVARGHQQRPGGVGAHPVSGQQYRGGPGDQRAQLGGEEFHLLAQILGPAAQPRSAVLVAAITSILVPGRNRAVTSMRRRPDRSRSCWRRSSGAVATRLRIWLRASVRSRRALLRATRNTRIISTAPFLAPPASRRPKESAPAGAGRTPSTDARSSASALPPAG